MTDNRNNRNGKFPLLERVPYLKELCKDKKVLHLGCTGYPYTEQILADDRLLHFELEKIARELYGFDLDQEGIDVLEKLGTKNLYRADLEQLQEVALEEKFEVIIAGEMIEHLSNPGLFLRGIQRFMNADTNLVVTTINAYCGYRNVVYGLRGHGGSNEPVHPDHVAYYSYSTLKLVLARANLTIDKFAFYDIEETHRPHMRWTQRLANDICVRLSRQWADGIIAECRLGND